MLRQILLAGFMMCGLCYSAGESTNVQKSLQKSISQKTKITKKNLNKTSFEAYHMQCLQGNGMNCLYIAQRLLYDPNLTKAKSPMQGNTITERVMWACKSPAMNIKNRLSSTSSL